MEYTFHDAERFALPRFRKMVQKLVPDFDDKKQYVLWLVCDLCSPYQSYSKEGSIKLYDVNDNEIDMSLFGLQHTKFLTRKPYYNKHICQIGVQKGSSRVYGIPLVFTDYHDILKIRTIKIHWDIIQPIFLHETAADPFDYRIKTMDIVYHVDFDVTDIDTKHWFTLSYQTYMFDEKAEYADKTAKYYDTALCVSNYHIVDDDGKLDTWLDLCEISAADNRVGKLSKHEEDIVTTLDSLSFDSLIQSARNAETGWIQKSDEWDADRYYYEKSVILQACPYADIVPESGFGFKD